MEKVIIVRYCEIHLKGKNRGFFERLLLENIKIALRGIDCVAKQIQSRYLIENFDDIDQEEIFTRLKKVAGIHTMSVGTLIKTSEENIYATAVDAMKDVRGTFKVETKRADKDFPIPSLEVSCEAGGRILDEYGDRLKVDVVNPEVVLSIDIRESGDTLIFCGFVHGVGGIPVGSSGKGVMMLSGGIDSPVAAYMMAKRGMKISCVHFASYPYTGEAAKQKVIDLCRILSPFTCGVDLYTVTFTKVQEAIHENCGEEYMITLMRRFMFRITELIGKSIGAQAIITGENLGQVASQTVESMTTSNSVVTLPVFRPVIGFDKLEIIELAKKIGTYETSILPYEDCCTVFLPKYPVIKPKLITVEKEEARLDVESLIEGCMSNIEKLSF